MNYRRRSEVVEAVVWPGWFDINEKGVVRENGKPKRSAEGTKIAKKYSLSPIAIGSESLVALYSYGGKSFQVRPGQVLVDLKWSLGLQIMEQAAFDKLYVEESAIEDSVTAAFKKTIADLETQLETAKQQLTGEKAKVTELVGKVTVKDNEITALKTRIEKLEKKLPS